MKKIELFNLIILTIILLIGIVGGTVAKINDDILLMSLFALTIFGSALVILFKYIIK